MSKKIRFSQPCATQWDYYNKMYARHKFSIDEFYLRISQRALHPFADWQTNQMGQFIWQLWFADAKKEMLHLFFMDASLRDLLETLPLDDLDGIKEYIAENGNSSEQDFLKLDNFYFGIHIPYENKYRGYAFHLMNNQDNQMILTWSNGEYSKNSGWLSDENYKVRLKENSENAKAMTRMFRLAINTIAYMKVFPECIKDGAPENLKEMNFQNSFTLQVAEKVNPIISNLKNGKMLTPHDRRGYFKRLRSDKFTHKQGQLIFVSETMVNGKAKTVFNTEKINEIETLT